MQLACFPAVVLGYVVVVVVAVVVVAIVLFVFLVVVCGCLCFGLVGVCFGFINFLLFSSIDKSLYSSCRLCTLIDTEYIFCD